MFSKIWSIGITAALALACGGDPGSSEGSGSGRGGGGGTTLQPKYVKVRVRTTPDDLPGMGELARVKVEMTGYGTVVTKPLAKYLAEPFQVNVNDHYLGPVGVTVEMPGFKAGSQNAWFEEEALLKAKGELAADFVLARDLTGSTWACTQTRLLNGVPGERETKQTAIRMRLAQQSGQQFYDCELETLVRGFLFIGYTIFGDNEQATYSGSVNVEGTSLDYDLTAKATPGLVYRYHCQR